MGKFRNRIPQSYNNERMLTAGYLQMLQLTGVFRGNIAHLKAAFPELRRSRGDVTITLNDYGEVISIKGASSDVSDHDNWPNDFDQIYWRALEQKAGRVPMGNELRYLRENASNPRLDGGLIRLSEVFFGKGENWQRRLHELVWSDELIDSGAGTVLADAFEDSQRKGHGFGGGLRLNSNDDKVRVSLWLLWNQVFLSPPELHSFH